MTTTRSKLLLLALFLGLAPAARADLLDEEETAPKTRPTPAPAVPSQVQPSGGQPTPAAKGKQRPRRPEPEASEGGDEVGVRGPTPHPKTESSTATTTVIPPKNAAKTGKSAGKADKRELPVHFDSKGLKGLRQKGMVELIQDVVVTQGDMRMEADHAQVFFDESAKDKKDRLQKVIAEGDPVKISGIDENSGEKFKAFGQTAIFLNKERTVVLEGNARLWRGDDSVIRSRKITYEMDTGWIRADRVAGELQPGDKAGAGTQTPTAPVASGATGRGANGGGKARPTAAGATGTASALDTAAEAPDVGGAAALPGAATPHAGATGTGAASGGRP